MEILMKNFIKKYNIKYFYHFTDINNLESIRKYGLFSLSEIQIRGIYVAIFGGNEWSHNADSRFGVDKYVHLAFDTNHPMLYFAQKENRINNPIWLKINTNIIFKDGVKFTNDVANKFGITPYNINEIENYLDCKALLINPIWKSEEYQNARRSELLIPNHIPSAYISW